MDSSSLLVSAASGLERLMVGNRDNPMMKDSTVAQISAALYYKAHVVAKLTSNKAFKNKFKTIIYTQIEKDFGNYIDAQARSKPKSFHHVYEWKKVGVDSARLFKLKMKDGEGISFKLNFEFLDSKSGVPTKRGRRRHIFIKKASVMEAGLPVIISPKNGKRLVFEGMAGVVFMPAGRSVTVKRPGGSGVKNQFTLHYSRWFSGQLVNESIKKSGFQQIFGAAMSKALRTPPTVARVKYSFAPNAIRNMADANLEAAFGGSLI